MKKKLAAILAGVMLFTTGIHGISYANDNGEDYSITINEYSLLKELSNEANDSLEKKGYSKSDINKIRNYSDEYIEHIQELKNFSESQLLEDGYTEEQVEGIYNFSGEEDDIMPLSSSVKITLPIDYVKKSTSGTTARFTAKFYRNGVPLVKTTDILAVSWNDWTLNSSSSYILYKKVGSTATTTGTGTRVNPSGTQSSGRGYKFPMTKIDNSYYADRGEFTYSLSSTVSNKTLSIYAAYGHSTISVQPSFSIPGYGSISFNYGTSTIKEQWNERKPS